MTINRNRKDLIKRSDELLKSIREPNKGMNSSHYTREDRNSDQSVSSPLSYRLIVLIPLIDKESLLVSMLNYY